MTFKEELYNSVCTVYANEKKLLKLIGYDPENHTIDNFYMAGMSCRAQIANTMTNELAVEFIETSMVIDFIKDMNHEITH